MDVNQTEVYTNEYMLVKVFCPLDQKGYIDTENKVCTFTQVVLYFHEKKGEYSVRSFCSIIYCTRVLRIDE